MVPLLEDEDEDDALLAPELPVEVVLAVPLVEPAEVLELVLALPLEPPEPVDELLEPDPPTLAFEHPASSATLSATTRFRMRSSPTFDSRGRSRASCGSDNPFSKITASGCGGWYDRAMTTERRQWDAEAYRRISAPQQRWGMQVLASLALRGDETVLDAGCGTGNLTKLLAAGVPRGKVLALDASPQMLEVARRELASFGERVQVVEADLGKLELKEVADVIFSSATFHWVLDQDALYAGLFRALRPRGLLLSQCGGEGNLAIVKSRAAALVAEKWASSFDGWSYPAYFAGIEETGVRLRRAGFVDIDVSLTEAPTTFASAASFTEFLDKVVLAPMLARLPDDTARSEALEGLAQQFAKDPIPFTLDYVRLNVRARRPG